MKKEVTTRKYPAYSILIFRIHALRQMFQRRISDSDIRETLIVGIIIEEYLMTLLIPAVFYREPSIVVHFTQSWHTIM